MYNKNIINPFVYIKHDDSLPSLETISEILVVPFFDKKILMIEEEDSDHHRFPAIRLEQAESLEKTVRREVYAQTGALVKQSGLLGILKFIDPLDSSNCNNIPIYVAQVYRIENTPLIPATYHRKLNALKSVMEELIQPYWKRIREYLLYHSYKQSSEYYKKN